MSGAPESADDVRTAPLTVGNIGFMLDRLGQDCSPLQFLRELTQNSVEAIGRTDNARGEILWDVEWNQLDLNGLYKLAIIDTGDGMSGDELVKYINQLSSSISEQSFEGNYGVGAKIAAATRNRAGLVYLSWKHGQGSMIHMWRDPSSGQYGLKQQQLPDGTYQFWLPVEDSLKPEIIKGHGTMVVLLGNDEVENTMVAPETSMSPSRWIARYLNTRYFQFPSGVRIRAREGWENPRQDTDRNVLRVLTGQRPYLDDHAVASGLVDLQSATAHWWVLREEKAMSQNSGYIASSGHIAALYQDELYEMETGRGGAAKLQQFGVYLGYSRVVIYIEPHTNGARLTPNTARTQLLLNSESLPWAEWAEAFRANMPAEIVSLIAEIAAGARERDHQTSIKDRLRQYRDLYRLSRYRPTPSGAMFLDDASSRPGGVAIRSERHRSQGGSSRHGGASGGTAGEMYALFATDKPGTPATEVQTEPWPIVHWITATDDTRSAGDLEDRAAHFTPETNVLQINADFRVFEDMIKRWCKQYEKVPAIEETVRTVVEEWFEQTLVETILGVQALDGAKEWTPENMNRALSEEALTAAVMPRYHVDVAVKRALGAKLGTLKV
jgi:hypothetical protein